MKDGVPNITQAAVVEIVQPHQLCSPDSEVFFPISLLKNLVEKFI